MGNIEVTEGAKYQPDANGFLKQVDPKPFEYDLTYKGNQATNTFMSGVRLGWLLAFVGYDKIKNYQAVDVGAGNGTFVKELKPVFKKIVPYDLCGETISDEELYGTEWDVVFFYDTLEHYKEIDAFWDLKFKYAIISFPETPEGFDLTKWKHRKPNEHLYLLKLREVIKWVEKHGYRVVASGCPEDAIRRRWDDALPNISTILILKKL